MNTLFASVPAQRRALAAALCAVLGTAPYAAAVTPAISFDHSSTYALRDDGVLFCFGGCQGHFTSIQLTNGAITPDAAMLDGVQFIPTEISGGGAALTSTGLVAWKHETWNSTAIQFTTMLQDTTGIQALAGRDSSNYAIKTDGSVLRFGGYNMQSPTVVTGLTDVARIIGSDLALTRSKTVITFSDDVWNTPPSLRYALDVKFNNGIKLTGVKDTAWAYYEYGNNTSQTHAISLLENGQVWQWAKIYNYNAGTETLSEPVKVALPQSAKAIHYNSDGWNRSKALAVLNDGSVYCWGDCDGDGATPLTPTPAPVVGLANVASVIATYGGGTDQLLGIALTSSGEVWTWGKNHAPSAVPGLSNVAQVATNYGNTVVAMKTDGMLCGWGDNSYGQLGANPAQIPITAPVCGFEDLIITPPPVASCPPAKYSLVKKTLTVPKLGLALYDPLSTKPSGKYAVMTGANGQPLTLALQGLNDFSLATNTAFEFANEVVQGNNTCYPLYSTETQTLQLNYVEVPSVIVVPLSNKLVELDAPLACYQATLAQSKLLPQLFALTASTEVTCR